MISVIVPVYNGQKYIEESINSIRNSSYKDLEILIVNDGSTDNSIDVVKRLKNDDSRITIYNKENGGIAEARQYGLDRANGEYVCFVDQDDIVKPFAFELLLRDIRSSGADFAQGQVGHFISDIESDVCNEDEVFIYRKGTDEYKKCLKYLIWKGCKEERKVPVIVGAGIYMNLFRRTFLVDNDIRIRKFCDYEDDWVLGAETLSKANIVCVNRKTTYLWRIHEESTLHNNVKVDRYIDNLYDKYCRLRVFMLECIKKSDISEEELEYFKQEHVRQTWLWCLSNETGKGIKGRTTQQSVNYLKEVMRKEYNSDYYGGRIKLLNVLSMTGYGMKGIKRTYHIFRDIILVTLLQFRMIWLAVWINKYLLHGRWHI